MIRSALIALGSNLGDRRAILDRAVTLLSEAPGVSIRAVSTYHETAPVGGPGGQGTFLNAAARLRTTLTPLGLLSLLRHIEADAGRVRRVRWGERTLDLDLLLYGRERVDLPELIVPHPRMAVRRFVLAPAAEVAPRMVDPNTGRTISESLAGLDRRPGYVPLIGPAGPGYDGLFRRLADALRPCYSPLIRTDAELSLEDEYSRASIELRAERWSEAIGGDGWLLTDYWFDQFYVSVQLRYASNPCRLLPFRDDFLRRRRNMIPPTFVAIWDPPEKILDASAEGHGWRRLRAAYRDYAESEACRSPLLWVEQSRPADAADEILAACEATRGG